ncbi:MAG: MFS transporter [Bacteroidetes bacterium]|nr:MFS transporter [Bacteroidota bacterium]MBS1930967.1 MFS transporter [Bacteroidota bacterium]
MQTASKKVINGWAMYDWANSVYSLVISSTILPAYYDAITKQRVDESGTAYIHFMGREFVSSALYNYTLAIAFLVVAIISPILSSIADYRGNKKSFMNFFLTMGSLACASLFLFNTSTGRTNAIASHLGFGLLSIIVACVGFWASLVYYNSFLPEIAAPKDRDRVSAKGFAMGYIGSVILQIISFVLVFFPGIVGGDETKSDASTIQFRMSFLLVGIWWWGFGQFSLSRLPRSIPAGEGNKKNILFNGYKELRKVWGQLTSMPLLKRYLVAYFFYNMGVQTVMLAATLYGKSELAIPAEFLIIAILIIQLIAIPGAFAISKLSEKIGNLKALMVCVAVWVFICIDAFFVPKGNIVQFGILASVVGFVMGGIQSLSRSTYSKLMPETKDTASFFSFYDVSEKIGIVTGLFFFGFLTELTGSQRTSVLALMVFFLIGFFLLLYAKSAQRKLSLL